MPALKNPRHEAFAQAIFSGITNAKGGAHSQAEAYRRAGYHVTNGNSAKACASRLLTFANGIGERIKELQAIAAEQAVESADKCVQELNQLRRDAHADKAYAAAVSAVMGRPKSSTSSSINTNKMRLSTHPAMISEPSGNEQLFRVGTPCSGDVLSAEAQCCGS